MFLNVEFYGHGFLGFSFPPLLVLVSILFFLGGYEDYCIVVSRKYEKREFCDQKGTTKKKNRWKVWS
jgi:hypothetical protein